MEISSVKIVVDSSANIFSLEGVDLASAPLKIITAQKEYTDDAALDIRGMVDDLAEYNGRSSTSCPNSEDWLEAFGEAENIFCITITSGLSGSYNAAMAAKDIYTERHPSRNVYVVNSLSTGPEMALIAQKIVDLAKEGKEFSEVCRQINEYTKKTGLLFVLSSMKNLANNGRVSPLIAKMAGLLGIRVVGQASVKGELQQLAKCRGERSSLECVVRLLSENGLKKGRVKIDHCFNSDAAERLKKLIMQRFPQVTPEISCCGGLCSFYAELGGVLIGYEKI